MQLFEYVTLSYQKTRSLPASRSDAYFSFRSALPRILADMRLGESPRTVSPTPRAEDVAVRVLSCRVAGKRSGLRTGRRRLAPAKREW